MFTQKAHSKYIYWNCCVLLFFFDEQDTIHFLKCDNLIKEKWAYSLEGDNRVKRLGVYTEDHFEITILTTAVTKPWDFGISGNRSWEVPRLEKQQAASYK